jgi:signal transduction histidine kinase/ActR/RegA family two-component response regulator
VAEQQTFHAGNGAGRSESTLDRRRALPPAAAVVAAVVLVLAGIGVSFYDKEVYREQKLRDIRVQAQIVAATVAPALMFEDSQAAQEYLNALNLNPSITAAAVYDANGQLVAHLRGSRGVPDHGDHLVPGAAFESETITVIAPIRQSRTNLGLVYLVSTAEPLVRRLTRYGGIVLLITMGALLLAVLLSAHTALRRANRELAARADELADANARLMSEMEQRERAQEALRQSQKMEAVGQLTGGIAHDFNNMLAIIISSLGILKRRAQRGEQNLSEYADRALEGAHRAATLTQRLLAFSRRQALSPESIEPNRLVSNMSELLRRTLGENIQVETVLAGGLWRAKADPHQLESAIVNLAVNSRDAMPTGGRLTIETSNAYLDDTYVGQHDELRPGQYVQISVSDAGTGMTPEVIAKSFEPFFTTKGVGKGTGLGLSQVYGFAKQSGGHVAIYSEVGRGTTVKLYLPRHVGEAEVEERHTSDIVGSADASTVLVVEDEEAVRHLATDALRELGYRVLEAESGRKALELLHAYPAIVLLFTDVVMPDMNGRELATAARKLKPGLKVLFTTGYTKNAVVHNGVLDPDVRLLSKPFTLEQLAQSVRLVLEDRTEPGRVAT